jgi:pimeloyl-ACP methyl ester carboxylesterase
MRGIGGNIAAFVAVALFAGCAGVPVGLTRADPRSVHRNLTGNVLSTGEPSIPTRNVLDRRDLIQRFEREPEAALADLHRFALESGDEDVFFALAELSFLHAERSHDRSWHLAAALYAWSFLFGGAPPEPFDPRLRVATDLYNRGLTKGMSTPDGSAVELRGGTFALPFGELDVEFDEKSLEWYGRRFRRFVPVADFEVRGLRSRFRTPGIGAPLAADAAVDDPDHSTTFVAPRLKVPVTALLRVKDVRKQIAGGRVRATLELHSDPEPERLEIAGRSVPLEREQTATIAAMLADSPIWKQELRAFFGDVTGAHGTGRLVALRPHAPGRIPVVFVHGTASNPGRWAEMLNDLESDARVYASFEPWFFFYNSGSPIIYSAHLLRSKLREAVEQMDPSGTDACLRDMVVIGHSQGGLLTKMSVVDSGDRFWRMVSRRPLEDLELSDADRKLVREVAFVEPLPFVKRVVFIATPHRGSFVAGRGFVRRLIRRLVSLPARVTSLTSAMLGANPDAFLVADFDRMNAVDNMSPGHRFVKTLAELPIAPGVIANSIIAVKGDGPVEEGNDGVVEYTSAHIEGVESELVVRSAHSTQSNPNTIEEVRRILLEHRAATTCARRPMLEQPPPRTSNPKTLGQARSRAMTLISTKPPGIASSVIPIAVHAG